MPSDSESMNNVLRFMTYEESEYERPVSVAMLDSVDKKGHIVLIEGVRTGTAKVYLYFDQNKYDIILFHIFHIFYVYKNFIEKLF